MPVFSQRTLDQSHVYQPVQMLLMLTTRMRMTTTRLLDTQTHTQTHIYTHTHTHTLVYIAVNSRIDYCNTVLAGARRTVTDKLQRVLNI